MLHFQASLLSTVLAAALFGQQAGSAGRGFLGVALQNTPNGRGARIAQLAPESPAARAGLVVGDVLLAVNGTAANGFQAMSELLRSLPPGAQARLKMIRTRPGQPAEINVTIGTAEGASASNQPAPTAASAPPAPAPPPANFKFEGLTDPLEHAFTMEAPAGWRSVAGLARGGLVQVNPYLRSLSPDKMTYLFFGDPAFPTFLVPNQMRTTIGLREGSISSDSVGGRAQIRRYQPGAEFARSYGATAFGGLCTGLKLVSSRDRPDLARKIEVADHNIIPTHYDAGEVEFSCVHNRQEMTAYAGAVTWITRDQIGMWVVRGFAGFIAPKNQSSPTHGILQHMIDSLRWEPAWNQMQTELSRQAGNIIQGRIAESERQQAAFNAKLNAMDQSFQDMDNIINGRSQYYDAQTGTHYDLSNATPFKWINDGGRVMGTATDVRPPGLSWRALPAAKGQ